MRFMESQTTEILHLILIRRQKSTTAIGSVLVTVTAETYSATFGISFGYGRKQLQTFGHDFGFGRN